jgi:hypothetical protein
MERSLARTTSWGLPAATVLGAAGVGTVVGAGPALLVLAAGALVGVIALMWASLRTLGGDAPLAEGFAQATTTTTVHVADVVERKRRVLRALKDLDLEHEVGKIDDADYAKLSTAYREEAKTILRAMDADVEPLRAKAEQMVKAHLKKKGLGEPKADDVPEPPTEPSRESPSSPARLACPKCATSNEPDAAFCKKCGAPLGARAEASDAVS